MKYRSMKYRIGVAALAASAAFALSGCMGDDYGYGYGGVSVGYADGYYGDPYWGWNDDYYYPGTGYYVYDRGGVRHRWNDSQRAYWEHRRGNRRVQNNWSGYQHNGAGGTVGRPGGQGWQQNRAGRQGLTDQQRQERRDTSRAQRQSQGASGQGDQNRRHHHGN